MRLTVIQSGGIAGVTRRWSADISQARGDRWKSAITSAHKCEHIRPDERMYDITLGDLKVCVPEHETRHGDLAELLRDLQLSTPRKQG